jgi:hypothetical protein
VSGSHFDAFVGIRSVLLQLMVHQLIYSGSNNSKGPEVRHGKMTIAANESIVRANYSFTSDMPVYIREQGQPSVARHVPSE